MMEIADCLEDDDDDDDGGGQIRTSQKSSNCKSNVCDENLLRTFGDL
jgi:hypothetical protein